MKNISKNTIYKVIIGILVILVIYLFYINFKRDKEDGFWAENLAYNQTQQQIPIQNGENLRFIFTHRLDIEQDVYSGGDFPSGTKTTTFNKGDIVNGRYEMEGCQGQDCIPERIVLIDVNGQNWPVNKSILIPYYVSK